MDNILHIRLYHEEKPPTPASYLPSGEPVSRREINRRWRYCAQLVIDHLRAKEEGR